MTYRICFPNAEGGVSIVVPAPGVAVADAAKAVPEGVEYTVVQVEDLPQDRTFRNGWVHDATTGCKEDHTKCLAIAHEKRREKRAVEFAPHDEIIAKQIPGKSKDDAEAARAAIRAKYDTVQMELDAAVDVAALKAVLETM
jgi:hypothetical protein